MREGTKVDEHESLATTTIHGVDVGFWNPVRSGRPVNNFGDLLGPMIVANLVGEWLDDIPARPDAVPPVLLTVGSLLHLAPKDAVVWGSGINGKALRASSHLPSSLVFRAVRGPWTRRFLQAQGFDVPATFGDPGLLTPLVFERPFLQPRARADVLVVPNLNDLARERARANALGIAVIDPRDALRSVIARIATSSFVIGSSLHGIVVAEAYGVPARFVASPVESGFKYFDYLSGTGRHGEPIAASIEEALQLGPQPPPVFDAEALLDAFPRDLWSNEYRTSKSQPRSIARVETRIAQWASIVHDSVSAGPTAEGTRLRIERRDRYALRLRDFLDEEQTDSALHSAAGDLLEARRWHYPDLPNELLSDHSVRALDKAVLGASQAEVLQARHRLRLGVQARAHSLTRRPKANILYFSVQIPWEHRPLAAVRLEHETLGTLPLPMSPFTRRRRAYHFDLNAVLPPEWGTPGASSMAVTLEFSDGEQSRHILRLDRVNGPSSGHTEHLKDSGENDPEATKREPR